MTTIMVVGNSEGARRCDSKCHNATKPACDCICRGRYHGCGNSKTAQEMLQKDFEEGHWGEEMMKVVKAVKQGEEMMKVVKAVKQEELGF